MGNIIHIADGGSVFAVSTDIIQIPLAFFRISLMPLNIYSMVTSTE